jgi:mono/diheme cytochrome c family protein
VTASIAGGGNAFAVIDVAPAPTGDAGRGAVLYGESGANCARCHGATGHGTDPDDNGTTYTYDNAVYDFPAPGLNAEPGNLANDPSWNAALLGVAAASDVDNGGVTLRAPMPDYLVSTNDEHPQTLTAQDYADLYAFLQTQTQ